MIEQPAAYLGWFDDNQKKTIVERINEGIAAFTDRFKILPTHVRLNRTYSENLAIAGITFIYEAYPPANTFWIGSMHNNLKVNSDEQEPKSLKIVEDTPPAEPLHKRSPEQPRKQPEAPVAVELTQDAPQDELPIKRGPGRPRKQPEALQATTDSPTAEPHIKRGPGRPRSTTNIVQEMLF